jgi:hypothetical protein
LVTIYTTCKFFMIWLRYVYYLQFISQLLIKKFRQDCVGSVLAKTCELEIDLGWYYQTCTLCASKVITQAGIMYYVKCKKLNDVVHRQVIHIQFNLWWSDYYHFIFLCWSCLCFQISGLRFMCEW